MVHAHLHNIINRLFCCNMAAKLAGLFDLGVGDGVLCVLPLHHTFEFSGGFLMPFCAAPRSPTSTS